MTIVAKKTFIQLMLLIVACIVAFLSIFPIYWMFVTSFTPKAEIYTNVIRIFPTRLSWENYIYAFRALPMLRIMWNTIFVAVVRTVLSLFLCSLAGFAFSKMKFPGKKILFLILLATMAIPVEATIVPVFIIMVKLGWIDTYYPLIIPFAASAFGIFFMRQYINTIPDELMDAARIDGCGYFKIYSHVILPVIRPALVTLSIFIFKLAWNEFLWPLIVIRKVIMQVMMVAIQTMPALDAGVRDVPWGATMAAATLSVLPLLILFLILQKEFISGATEGSIK